MISNNATDNKSSLAGLMARRQQYQSRWYVFYSSESRYNLTISLPRTGDRMRKTKNSDPNTTYIKAVDDETGEIMGMAKCMKPHHFLHHSTF